MRWPHEGTDDDVAPEQAEHAAQHRRSRTTRARRDAATAPSSIVLSAALRSRRHRPRRERPPAIRHTPASPLTLFRLVFRGEPHDRGAKRPSSRPASHTHRRVTVDGSSPSSARRSACSAPHRTPALRLPSLHMPSSSRRIPVAPPPSSAAASAVMRGNRKTDTRPETAVRSELHRRGHRFLKNVRPEPDIACRVDIVFRRPRLAVFVDGCFWHGSPDHGTQPRTNTSYWAPKIARNIERDKENDQLLVTRGWHVLRIWEHESTSDAADRVEAALNRVG